MTFQAAHARGEAWPRAVAACLDQLTPPGGGRGLGFVYVADPFSEALDEIVAQLAAATGVRAWVGAGARGVCASGRELVGEGAVALLLADLPPERFCLLDGIREGAALEPRVERFARAHAPAFGIVHADPGQGALPDLVQCLARTTDAFLVGGLISSRQTTLQIAGLASEGGLGGVLLAPEVAVVTGLTQACSPIGPVHRITSCHQNLVHTLDGRAALELLEEEIGELLARNLERALGYIHVALPLPGHDRSDYLVRNLLGIDRARGVLAIGAEVAPGQPLMFVRRDGPSAQRDLDRLLADLKARTGGRPIRGALYHACIARGPHLFGPGSAELGRIRAVLDDVPLAGAFLDGEIFHDRLYAYTGVLTLFL